MQALDVVEGVLEGHAIRQCSLALLELLYGRLGVYAVVTVKLSAGESQNIESFLQLFDVVTMEVGEAQVQRAVTQLVALVDERHPGCRVDLGSQAHVVVKTKLRHGLCGGWAEGDRKSTRLNSSHARISYAVFCLKKKKLNALHT